ncbi:MAG: autotransporter outer membrane beta-barrel domain-containing protein, partial [Candidatus Competibacteraceae bacterium]|nr:autotransporter outer membrane beta-barrel domain-containing protein [Candidatus Competibacteraceae bacterium]MCB1806365.1 autotransporter outer membrane beta-barrel domain-containing protein [Candidatus Competibacteraceae bacterium]
ADFFRDAWLLSPYLGLDYITASVDEFSESGGAGLALTVTTEDIDILTSKLGVRVSRSYSMSWGILSPTAFAEWAHEFKDDSREITSRFVADPSVPFTTSTDDPDRNYFNLGLGASATFTEGRSGFINYRGRFGDSDYQSNTIEAGMRFEF